MALDGNLLGATVAGPRQTSAGPSPGSLSIAFLQQDNYPGSATSGHFLFSPTPPTIIFQQDNSQTPANLFFKLGPSGNPVPLPIDRQTLVVLSTDLLMISGFGKLSVDNSDGDIILPVGESLVALRGSGPGQSSISLKAANLTIDGQVSALGGNLSFVTYGATPFQKHLNPNPGVPVPPVLDDNRGLFTLGAAATLSTAGLIVDDRFAVLGLSSQPLAINGGNVSISSYNADLVAGSSIDASGGAYAAANGKFSFGNAGKIGIIAGQDPGAPSLAGGKLILDAALRAFSAVQGGSLSLQATLVQIGGAAPATNPDTSPAPVAGFLQPRRFCELYHLWPGPRSGWSGLIPSRSLDRARHPARAPRTEFDSNRARKWQGHDRVDSDSFTTGATITSQPDIQG